MVVDGVGLVAPLSWAGGSMEPLMRVAAEAADGVAVEVKAGARHRSDGRAHGKREPEVGRRPGPPKAGAGRSLEDSAGGANYTMASSYQQMAQELLQLSQQPQNSAAIMHVQWLLQNALSSSFLNATDELGRTALHHTMLRGDESMMQLLAAAPDIDFNVIDSEGCTPLALAVAAGHDRLVTKLLFAASANTRAVARLDATLHGAGRPEASPIALALAQSTVDCLKALLHTIKLQDRLQDGMGQGQRLSPEALPHRRVQSNAPTEVQPELGRYSVRSSHHVGLGAGAAAEVRPGWSHTAGACSLAALLRQPCDHHGRPALLVAVRAKRLQHAFLLVSYGARLNTCEPEGSNSKSVPEGSTPLHILIRHIARLEGTSGGHSQSSPHQTQLNVRQHGRSGSPTMSSPGTPSSQLPLSSSTFSSQTPLAQAHSLFAHMVSQPAAAQACYQQDVEGNTPLHVAAAAGLVTLADQLLQAASAKSALLHMRNQAGFTALQAAAAAQHQAVVQLLTDAIPRQATAYTTGHARVLAAITGSDHASSLTSGQDSTAELDSTQGSSIPSSCPSPHQPHPHTQPYTTMSTPGTRASHTSPQAVRQYSRSTSYDGRKSHTSGGSSSTAMQEGSKSQRSRAPQPQHTEITPAPIPTPTTSRPLPTAAPHAHPSQPQVCNPSAAAVSQQQKEAKSGNSLAKAFKKLFS